MSVLTIPTVAAPPRLRPLAAQRLHPTAVGATAAISRRWLNRYARLLMAADVVAMALAGVTTAMITPAGTALGHVPAAEAVATSIAVALWFAFSLAGRTYERRYLGTGSEEYKRVFAACLRAVVTLSLVSFALQLPTSRLALGLLFAIGAPALLVERYAARKALQRMRRGGRCVQRVIAVGTAAEVTELVARVRRDRVAGFEIVGACVPESPRQMRAFELCVPVLGSPAAAVTALRETGADTVAVAGSRAMGSEELRQLAWQLEGTGVDLVVAPAITDVAGPRIHVRPVAGLPLLHVEEPDLSGPRRLLKVGLERVAALVLLLLVAPLGLLVAAAVKLSSPGPVFYRQVRVGLRGREFGLWKFRTMVTDADRHLAAIADQNDSDGLLFKMRRDPRVTAVGRRLRRYSLDELPQLLNVVLGSMALVGPRPPLPAEVAAYGPDVRRRLLVKPGLTGLWQVSGRSDLSWDESVRLDLHYVENWSPALDLMILWKTFFAVLAGRGAY